MTAVRFPHHPSARVAERQMQFIFSSSAARLHNMQEAECKGRKTLSGAENAKIGQGRKRNRAFLFFSENAVKIRPATDTGSVW